MKEGNPQAPGRPTTHQEGLCLMWGANCKEGAKSGCVTVSTLGLQNPQIPLWRDFMASVGLGDVRQGAACHKR